MESWREISELLYKHETPFPRGSSQYETFSSFFPNADLYLSLKEDVYPRLRVSPSGNILVQVPVHAALGNLTSAQNIDCQSIAGFFTRPFENRIELFLRYLVSRETGELKDIPIGWTKNDFALNQWVTNVHRHIKKIQKENQATVIAPHTTGEQRKEFLALAGYRIVRYDTFHRNEGGTVVGGVSAVISGPSLRETEKAAKNACFAEENENTGYGRFGITIVRPCKVTAQTIEIIPDPGNRPGPHAPDLNRSSPRFELELWSFGEITEDK
ncbi:MAG: hypothetical protein WC797_01905 [Candidatus Paceibacterota bacterium]|jgi:hypothetical protein